MKITLSERGQVLATTACNDSMLVLGAEEPPVIKEGVWSFANDLLQFLSFTETPDYPDITTMVQDITDKLITAHYSCTVFAVRGAIQILRATDCIRITGEETTVLNLVQIDAGLAALSNTTRLLILRLLQQSPITGSELSRELEIPQPQISQHLRVLKSANLVMSWRESRGVKYSTNLGALRQLVECLLQYIQGGLNG